MESTADFKSFDLDPRLLKAISKMGYTSPTLIQAEAIPLALQGKDIVARARTGSGKTAAYCIPIMQKVLRRKDEEASMGSSSSSARTSKLASLILVPTKELSEQVKDTLDKFTHYTYKLVTVCNLCNYEIEPNNSEGASDASVSDIIIGTPGTVARALGLEWIDFSNLEILVLDEADLLVSYGYHEDLTIIISRMPRICQGMLMSATFSSEVDDLKKMMLRTPVVLKLTEPEAVEAGEAQITEYTIPVEDDSERFTALYAVLKLGIVTGKTIIFVNDVQRCFRLKLFLDKFSIRSAVLNSNLPVNARIHTIQEFNLGSFQYLLAADDSDIISEEDDDEDDVNEDEEENEEGEDEEMIQKGKGKKGKNKGSKNKKGKGNKKNVSETEFSMSRGVDFVDVAAVINLDLPNSPASYTHRIGRTGRGKASGLALSFFTKKDTKKLKMIIENRAELGCEVKPYEIKKSVIASFKYRCEDVYRAISLSAVKRAADVELKAEILNSEKLKEHFKENPREQYILKNQLKHERRLLAKKAPMHLKQIPEYLLPPSLGGTTASELTKDVELGKEDAMDMLSRKRVRHSTDLKGRPAKRMRSGDNIPVSLGGKPGKFRRNNRPGNGGKGKFGFKSGKKYHK